MPIIILRHYSSDGQALLLGEYKPGKNTAFDWMLTETAKGSSLQNHPIKYLSLGFQAKIGQLSSSKTI